MLRKFSKSAGALSLIVAAWVTPAVASVVHLVDGSGQLIGAQNVDVNGALYDVALVDGSCADEFTGCDDASDFAFPPFQSIALLAAGALQDQVFVDSAAGQFDSDPSKIFGCSDASLCVAFTIYQSAVNFVYAAETSNYATGAGIDAFGLTGTGPGSFAASTQYVWAKWTPSPTAVPVPASAVLLLTGVGFLGWRGTAARRFARPSRRR